MLKKLILCLIALNMVMCQSTTTLSIKESLFQEGLEKQLSSDFMTAMESQLEDKQWKTTDKSGAFFYTQENALNGWAVSKFGFEGLDMQLNAKNNGSLSVMMNKATFSFDSTYSSLYWVEWLKNQTGSVTFDVTCSINVDYHIGMDSNQEKVQLTELSDIQVVIFSVNSTLQDDQYEQEDNFSQLFKKKLAGPGMAAVQKMVSSTFQKTIASHMLDKIKERVVYPIANDFQYKLKFLPTLVQIVQDKVLTVVYATRLYDYSQEVTYKGQAMSTDTPKSFLGKSKQSLLEYEIDSKMIGSALNAYFDKMAGHVHSFDHSQIGKIIGGVSLEGDMGWFTMNQIFRVDDADKVTAPDSYFVAAQLVKDSARVVVGKSTSVSYQVKVFLQLPNHVALSSQRDLTFHVETKVQAILQGSELKANHLSTSVTSVTVAESTGQVTLTAEETEQYIIYANLFTQLKGKLISHFCTSLSFDLDNNEINPLNQLTKSITSKIYQMQVESGYLNIEVASAFQLMTSRLSAQEGTSSSSSTTSAIKLRPDSQKFIQGINTQDYEKFIVLDHPNGNTQIVMLKPGDDFTQVVKEEYRDEATVISTFKQE